MVLNIVNLGEARKHLSRLVEAAARGEPFVIARAGKPLVKVIRFDPTPARTAFLEGQVDVPADFDRMAETEIAALFDGTSA